MKKSLRNLLFPTLFTSIFSGYGKIMADVPIISKKHWKGIVTAIALPLLINSSVKAGYLSTRSWSSLGNPNYVGVWHKLGATEDYGQYDALFLPLPWNPAIDFYSKTSLPYPADKLMKDSRPPESTTPINLEISGRGLGAPENATLQFVISYPQGEDNFSWKNIIGELSQRVDDGNGGYKYALIGDYDIKYMVNSARTIPISINNGITQGEFFPSHKLDYSFFNYTDFNRDRSVNGLDFAIFARNWARDERAEPNDPNNTLGTYVGKDPNDFDAYSDIDRNGRVDYNDLSFFSGEWLWDANDPNTWSRVR
jgi:hypothetical protein